MNSSPARKVKRTQRSTHAKSDVLAETQLNVNTPPPPCSDKLAAYRAPLRRAAANTLGHTDKSELCKYLNLLNLKPMNIVGDENLPLPNRRSYRLKNYRLQKDLMEKKLRSEEIEADSIEGSSSVKEISCTDATGTAKTTWLVDPRRSAVDLLLPVRTGKGAKRKIVHVTYDQLQSSFVLPIKSLGERLILKPLGRGTFTKFAPDREISAYKDSTSLSSSIVHKTTVDAKIPSTSSATDLIPVYKNLVQTSSEGTSSRSQTNLLDYNRNSTSDLTQSEDDCKSCSDNLNAAGSCVQKGIIDVVHVPEKFIASPSRSVSSSSKSLILNNCEFVDLTRRSSCAAIFLDHPYCKAPASEDPLGVEEESSSDEDDGLPPETPYAGDGQAHAMPLVFIKRSRSAHTLDSLREAAGVAVAGPARGTPPPPDYRAHFSKAHGAVLSCHFVEYCLVVAQEERVTFFQQSGLGMFLESQAMWIPRGFLERLQFDAVDYVRKKTSECVLHTCGGSVAYVELYCKEHKQASRAAPSCDVFIVVYHCSTGDNATKCKVLQLNKFTGYAGQVRFVVVQKLNSVAVYREELSGSRSTSMVNGCITSYTLSADYEYVSGGYAHERATHFIRSLHVVVDCDFTLVGFNKGKMSFWCAQSLVRSIELPGPEYACASLRCERGFIFVLQHTYAGNMLRLMGINVSDFSQKTLQLYHPPYAFKDIEYACMLDGDIFCFFKQGRVCWSMESGLMVSSGYASRTAQLWPCGPWLITVDAERIFVTRLWKGQGARYSNSHAKKIRCSMQPADDVPA